MGFLFGNNINTNKNRMQLLFRQRIWYRNKIQTITQQLYHGRFFDVIRFKRASTNRYWS